MATAKFHELAGKRSANALSAIRLLGNLRRKDYESSAEDLTKIVDALQDAVDDLRSTYRLPCRPSPVELPLDFAPVRPAAPEPDPIPVPVAGNVCRTDRQVIRDGLALIVKGETREGAAEIRRVVLSWTDHLRVAEAEAAE